MPLTKSQREQVVATAVELLKHRQRERVIELLERRLALETYSDPEERRLDEIALAVTRTIDEQLAE